MLEVRGVAAFEDNYIWLAGRPGSGKVLIVDPGDADPVIERLEEAALLPEAILITHRHGDHTGGVRELAGRFGIDVYGPAHEPIPGLTRPVTEGQQLHFHGGITLTVMETPGHTRGHICFYGETALFCGDTLFAAGCGRLFEGTPQQMHASLERLRALPDPTRVFCAHEYTLDNLRFARIAEPENGATQRRFEEVQAVRSRGEPTVPSVLQIERETNPFLRSHSAPLRAAAEAYTGRKLLTEWQVFEAVRAWKDALD